MKINKGVINSMLMLIMISTVGCNAFLDKEPYTPSPTSFFNNAEQLDAYVLPNYSLFSVGVGYNLDPNVSGDTGTDNQVNNSGNDTWIDGRFQVEEDENWDWTALYNINYFFDIVLPKYEAGKISGDIARINHYIGEMYFFRAYNYFSKLKSIGDVPIILNTLVDQRDSLVQASIRQPRNKVARQIISDLDKAVEFMQESPDGGTNRLSKKVALLLKSRVALYEASWERNFAGTAFVPNGEGWAGKSTHPNYAYDASTEINFFLDEALEASELVADAISLTSNPASYDYTKISGAGNTNPYFEMFGTLAGGLQSVPEVLLFKRYDIALGVSHNMVTYLMRGGIGYTHQYMKNFLMANGLPIYASGSGYAGDREINDIKVGRDSRLQLFVQAPNEGLDDNGKSTDPVPDLLGTEGYDPADTGYSIKKGAVSDASQWLGGNSGTTDDVIFRAVEAYLNYIEAYYLKHKTVGGKADTYWKAIRRRANVDEDYMKTVNATDMNEEAKVDLAAYTAGQLISPLEYNIRRERRSEFIAEGFRWGDLKRYRAMDQLINDRVFIPQGINLWEYHYNHNTYKDVADGTTLLKPGDNISANEAIQTKQGEVMEGKYLYPQRYRESNNLYFGGYTFNAAHYLNPIGSEFFMSAIPSGGGNSVIYQNPGWELTSGSIAQPIVGFK